MSSGFGIGVYGLSPLGIAASQAATASPARVSSSRQIDPLTKRFVQAANGGYGGMPDTVQRVLNKIRVALAGRQAVITPEGQRDAEQRIRAALADEQTPQDPQIELLTVTVSDDGGDAELCTVEFRDLVTGQVVTVKPRRAP